MAVNRPLGFAESKGFLLEAELNALHLVHLALGLD